MYKNLNKNTKKELIDNITEKDKEITEKDKEIIDLKEKIKDLEGKLNTNTTNSHNSSSSEKINMGNYLTPSI